MAEKLIEEIEKTTKDLLQNISEINNMLGIVTSEKKISFGKMSFNECLDKLSNTIDKLNFKFDNFETLEDLNEIQRNTELTKVSEETLENLDLIDEKLRPEVEKIMKSVLKNENDLSLSSSS